MKKHILFIVENNAVPFDIRVWREAVTAKRCGYKVTVISPQDPKAMDRYEVKDGVEIYRHKQTNDRNGTFGFIFEYLSAFFWELIFSLIVYFRKPFHLIHAANPPDHIFLLAIFYKLLGVKFIFDHHDLSPELYLTKFPEKSHFLFRMLLLMEKASCKFADVVISTNQSFKKIITNRHNINPEKIFIVRNDPDIDNCCSSSSSLKKAPEQKINILYLGSINPQDGVDILIYVINCLVNDLKEYNIKCTIIGDGSSLNDVKTIAQTLKIQNYCDFKGYIHDRTRIKDFLRSADICVETAPKNGVNEHSTFIKIMEYMAAGKPIVAFDLKETKYSSNGCALLAKVGDISGFAEKIKLLIDSDELRTEIGKAGLERVRKKYNWQNAATNLKKAYNILLE